jgi:hypothetical protein
VRRGPSPFPFLVAGIAVLLFVYQSWGMAATGVLAMFLFVVGAVWPRRRTS